MNSLAYDYAAVIICTSALDPRDSWVPIARNARLQAQHLTVIHEQIDH